jgi:predicted nucleic acid-binding protein
MAFVLDASITGCWLLPDEDHPAATRALDRLLDEHALVPAIWWYEIRNLLVACERRGRLDADRSNTALAMLAGLPITIEPPPDDGSVLVLARRHRLSVYDAAYLELAQREAIELATLDAALGAAARAEHVPVITA